MTLNPQLLSYLIAAALGVVLTWAAYSDYRHRRIPNSSVLAVLALFVAWTVAHHFVGLGPALLWSVGMLVVSFGLSVAKIFGAGDAKFVSALTLFMGSDHLLSFVLVTALAGGVLAIVGLLSNPRRVREAMSAGGGGGIATKGVPYGVAIAIGAAVTIGYALFPHA